jgi:hypothetical protein
MNIRKDDNECYIITESRGQELDTFAELVACSIRLANINDVAARAGYERFESDIYFARVALIRAREMHEIYSEHVED